MSTDCIFCKIVSGGAPSHQIWSDDEYLAFLSIFPNTEGVSVVIPKQHYGSYIFDAPDAVVTGLLGAAKEVAGKIEKALPDVGRVGIIFEGFGVDHLHAKLFPMHGTKSDKWKERKSSVDKYFEVYEGYLSSHDYKRADDAELAAVAEKIKKA